MHRWTAAAAACGLLLLAGCGAEDEEPAPLAAPPANSAGSAGSGAGSVGRCRVALAGRGTAASLSEAERVQWIDKGTIVTLKVHALDEFDGAKEKLAAGELDPEEGAAHNVDEVWAYFSAEDEGVIATAAKRAEDFGLGEHELGNDVIAGIAAAQKAVSDKDAAALDAATQATRGAMNRIFALAVKKYAVEGAEDATARAEGLAFSWGLEGQLDAADLKTIQAALAPQPAAGSPAAVARTLDGAAGDMGIKAQLPAYPPTGS